MSKRRLPARTLAIIKSKDGHDVPITSPTTLEALKTRDEQLRHAGEVLEQLADELGSTRSDLGQLEASAWVQIARRLHLHWNDLIPRQTERGKAALEAVKKFRAERAAQRVAESDEGEEAGDPTGDRVSKRAEVAP